jgi:hypothetical protein
VHNGGKESVALDQPVNFKLAARERSGVVWHCEITSKYERNAVRGLFCKIVATRSRTTLPAERYET